MNVLLSSTLPNAFDTEAIAEAKLLQIAQGDERAVALSGTVEYSSTLNDAFDTETIILEKLLQGFVSGVGGDEPPIVAGQQYLQSDDDTWHLIDLQLVDGVNVVRVGQADVASPGAEFAGFVVLIADDGSRHKLSVVNYGGEHLLQLHQETTPEAGVNSISLVSSDAAFYDVGAALYDEMYVVTVEQPA